MSRIESLDDALFTPLTTDQADHVAGGVAAPTPTYARDFVDDGKGGYVIYQYQIDGFSSGTPA